MIEKEGEMQRYHLISLEGEPYMDEDDNGAYYLVEEVDKLLAEKDKEIANLKKELEKRRTNEIRT